MITQIDAFPSLAPRFLREHLRKQLAATWTVLSFPGEPRHVFSSVAGQLLRIGHRQAGHAKEPDDRCHSRVSAASRGVSGVQ